VSIRIDGQNYTVCEAVCGKVAMIERIPLFDIMW
jgi:hypothetical protein